jgi:hypothetical protein
VTIVRDRSNSDVVSMVAPANASGNSVPGGRGNETAVCCKGRTGVDGPLVTGLEDRLDVGVLENDHSSPPSGVSA